MACLDDKTAKLYKFQM